ncbi:carboxypeptidase regulatory-like domain-containing protein, partial [Roseisolibacter sp. H3M3-2]|uniref:TonB-dependent receptor n=1 Tax=Roseisolibacter sp. H3M3-2 TaxID=3031323 RepID=UPI0023DCA280
MPPAPRRAAARVLARAVVGAAVPVLPALPAVAVGALLAAPATAGAQVGSTTDIVTGRVLGAAGQPVEGAQVTVTSVETGVSRTRATNARGQYTVLFPDGGGRYRITVRAIGQLPQTVNVQRESDEDRLVANVTLGAAPTQLTAVRVQASRAPAGPPGGQRPEPGNTERNISTDQALRLPVDASDPTALAALTAGVVLTPGGDSTQTGFNVAGQSAAQNNTTLDGVSFGGGAFPQEAVRSTRVITNTFDVARGQFSGGQVASTTRGGTNNLYVGGTYNLREPRLQWRPGFEGAFGQGFTQNSLSLGVGGPFVRDRAFWFVSGSVQRRSNPLQSLVGADPEALRLIGASSDSVSRFLSELQALGVGATQSGIPGSQLNDNVNAIARLDLNVTEQHTLSLRGDYRVSEQDATRIGALAVPTFGGDTRTRGGGVMLTLSSRLDREILGGTVINEAKVYATGEERRAAPYVDLPASRVRVTSDLGDGTTGLSTLSFGGNPGLNNDDQTNYVEATEEVSWASAGGGHRVKMGGLLNASRYDQRTAFNPYGTYTFNSLEDFLGGRPALFTRSLQPRTNEGGAINAAGYLGDTWRQSRSFQLTYGARVEGSTYSGAPALNPAVRERFGLETNRFPGEVRVSPRVGFSYTFFPDTGRGGGRRQAQGQGQGGGRGRTGQPAPFLRGGPTLFVRGGIGEFRGRASSSLFSAAQQGSGLAGAESQLVCAGAAVPVPDYGAYVAQGTGAIPTQCLPVEGAQTPAASVQASPAVTAIADDFRAPRTWRANLGVTRRFWERFTASLDASYTMGQAQYAVRDLNLDTSAPEFALAAEGGRPVWVPAAAIVPATGASVITASRVDPRFAQVFEVGSRFRSRNAQATAALNGVTSRGMNFNLSYTLARTRDQASTGFGNPAGAFGQTPTAGDPNVRTLSTSDQDVRHNLIGTVTYPLHPSFEVTAVARATSGRPYTPTVSGDVNGDGSRNDAAFVFDPAQLANDPALQAGLQRVLATTPEAARECLLSQMGRVASRNSCRGPWTPSLDLQLNYKPDHFGLKRRLTISTMFVNPLAGIDQLVHGADDLRGWGQFARPDATLLAVRGFDAANRRYVYEVNERFGSTRQQASAFRQTFQVGIQARYVYGQGGGFGGFGGFGGGGGGGGQQGGGGGGGLAALLGAAT